MENEIATMCSEGLGFFSKTNRLISHELKNVLAIISETLGLIDELSAMAKEGVALPPGKLKSLSESVLEEVGRANHIIRNMNRFAHEVDRLLDEVDITQTIPLTLDLAGLDANVKKLSFHIAEQPPCFVYTSSFYLNGLIFNIIRKYAKEVPSGEIVDVTLKADDVSVNIVFSGIHKDVMGDFPSDTQIFLADILSASLTLEDSRLVISIPKSLDNSPLQNILKNPCQAGE